jgi:hypothetical protein
MSEYNIIIDKKCDNTIRLEYIARVIKQELRTVCKQNPKYKCNKFNLDDFDLKVYYSPINGYSITFYLYTWYQTYNGYLLPDTCICSLNCHTLEYDKYLEYKHTPFPAIYRPYRAKIKDMIKSTTFNIDFTPEERTAIFSQSFLPLSLLDY